MLHVTSGPQKANQVYADKGIATQIPQEDQTKRNRYSEVLYAFSVSPS